MSFLIAGWDAHKGYQLYHTDPSGNFDDWKATAIGKKAKSAVGVLKEEWQDNMSLDDAYWLCLTVLSRALEISKIDEKKIQICTFSRKMGRSSVEFLPSKDLSQLCSKYVKKSREEAQKTAQSSFSPSSSSK